MIAFYRFDRRLPENSSVGPAMSSGCGGGPCPCMDFAIWGPIAPGDLPGLCERVCALLSEGEAHVARCDVRGVAVDAVTVDALARLQLAARRHGCQVRLCNASGELLELVAFMGLTDVLPDG
jgi:ABC-type transporter Mla MlaB component